MMDRRMWAVLPVVGLLCTTGPSSAEDVPGAKLVLELPGPYAVPRATVSAKEDGVAGELSDLHVHFAREVDPNEQLRTTYYLDYKFMSADAWSGGSDEFHLDAVAADGTVIARDVLTPDEPAGGVRLDLTRCWTEPNYRVRYPRYGLNYIDFDFTKAPGAHLAVRIDAARNDAQKCASDKTD